MTRVMRIHLKTDTDYRDVLVDYCLKSKQQCLAIGWSFIFEEQDGIVDYAGFYDAIKKYNSKKSKPINHALNAYRDVNKDDLFWTRDLDGNYYICRVKDSAKVQCISYLDIGAVLPVEAYKVGLQVPGKIKASFNRPRGGIIESITDENMLEYSKYVYNTFSGENYYSYNKIEGDIIDNLPDFDLEELVIIYLQIKKNYYVLSNSIANKSTTIKIECEMISRDKNCCEKAVVQVKAGKKKIDAMDYRCFCDEGYTVYLYANSIENIDSVKNCVEIKKEELLRFYSEYKAILPASITIWENIFKQFDYKTNNI